MRTTGSAGLLGGALSAVVAAAGAGCNPPPDASVMLQTEVIAASLGSSTGTLAATACSSAADPCALFVSQLRQALSPGGQAASALFPVFNIVGSCDVAAWQCQAQVAMTLVGPVIELRRDPQYASTVSSYSIEAFRSISFAYSAPKDSLSFDLPSPELFLASWDASRAALADNEPVSVEKLPTLAHGKGFAEASGILSVDPVSAAGQRLLTHAWRRPSYLEFVLQLKSSVMFHAGDPLPAGDLQLSITPALTIGFARPSIFIAPG